MHYDTTSTDANAIMSKLCGTLAQHSYPNPYFSDCLYDANQIMQWAKETTVPPSEHEVTDTFAWFATLHGSQISCRWNPIFDAETIRRSCGDAIEFVGVATKGRYGVSIRLYEKHTVRERHQLQGSRRV